MKGSSGSEGRSDANEPADVPDKLYSDHESYSRSVLVMQKVGKSLEIIDPKCAGDQVAPNMRDLSSPTHIRHYAYKLTVGLPHTTKH